MTEEQLAMGFTQSPQTGVSVGALEAVCGEIAELRAQEAELSSRKKAVSTALEEKETVLIELLRACEKDSYHSKFGTATIKHRTSVRIPREEKDREAFFGWLRERGIYDSTVSVNSQTLNSLYKAEFEAAKERGEGMDFSIPGINEVTVLEELSFLRKRN